MRVPNCVSTPEEEALVSRINFDASTLRTSEDVERNGAAAAALMKSLSTRNAIPEMRLRYFTDPVYFVGGRGKSRKDLLERNGNKKKRFLAAQSSFRIYIIFCTDLRCRKTLWMLFCAAFS
jgi:hypothetical protein